MPRRCLPRVARRISKPTAVASIWIQKRIAARVTVANACTREIVKLCGGSTKETSKSIPCLTTTQGVSLRCIQAMDEAGYR